MQHTKLFRVAILLLVLGGLLNIPAANQPTSVSAATYYVILDPGHGGTDPGAPPTAVATACGAPTNNKEKDRTLDIARRVRDILQANNIRVGMTRDGDTNPSSPFSNNFHKQ